MRRRTCKTAINYLLSVLDPKLSDLFMNRLKLKQYLMGAELYNVAKLRDDLWLGVKGQSNLEIAGSLRNLFR